MPFFLLIQKWKWSLFWWNSDRKETPNIRMKIVAMFFFMRNTKKIRFNYTHEIALWKVGKNYQSFSNSEEMIMLWISDWDIWNLWSVLGLQKVTHHTLTPTWCWKIQILANQRQFSTAQFRGSYNQIYIRETELWTVSI